MNALLAALTVVEEQVLFKKIIALAAMPEGGKEKWLIEFEATIIPVHSQGIYTCIIHGGTRFHFHPAVPVICEGGA